MRFTPRSLALFVTFAGVALAGAGGCSSGPPRHVADPDPRSGSPGSPRDERPLGGPVDVRVALHWEPGAVLIESPGGVVAVGPGRTSGGPARDSVLLSAGRGGAADDVVVGGPGIEERGPGPWILRPVGDGRLRVDGRRYRGHLEVSARGDSLFVVAVLPLEDYLRGVVPREIGPRPEAELEVVAAQAVAARTYTIKRLGQYGALPFDVFSDVQDQVYEGIDGENAVADAAIRQTTGLVLADREGLIEAFYSSTCGGRRSDIAAVWPWREHHRSLRGGPDGGQGAEWCRESPHFRWTETWDGAELASMMRSHVPRLLDLPAGAVTGALVDLRVRKRGPSGRAAEIEWRTSEGRWTVPGDRNRWILRRAGGGILRSVWIDLDVERRNGQVVRVTIEGRGNGHGVGMCQTGAIGRARAGQGFRQILGAYYPGSRIRRVRGDDLPKGQESGA